MQGCTHDSNIKPTMANTVTRSGSPTGLKAWGILLLRTPTGVKVARIRMVGNERTPTELTERLSIRMMVTNPSSRNHVQTTSR